MTEITNPQSVILVEIADPTFKRDHIAKTFPFCLRQHGEVSFRVVNRAIIDRWSFSALDYIKTKAFALARQWEEMPG